MKQRPLELANEDGGAFRSISLARATMSAYLQTMPMRLRGLRRNMLHEWCSRYGGLEGVSVRWCPLATMDTARREAKPSVEVWFAVSTAYNEVGA